MPCQTSEIQLPNHANHTRTHAHTGKGLSLDRGHVPAGKRGGGATEELIYSGLLELWVLLAVSIYSIKC
jgi:hypothetical protein